MSCSKALSTSLHSTMSLLLRIVSGLQYIFTAFTFHYVSITTTHNWIEPPFIVLYIPLCLYYYGSSIHLVSFCYAFLYIPLCLYYYSAGVNMSRLSPFFTFHYVSITTERFLLSGSFFLPLHSTMSLLLQGMDTTGNRGTLLYIPLCLYYYKA